MKISFISHVILITFFLFTSCNNVDNPRYLGNVSVGELGVLFKLYQEDIFDSSVGIYCEITDNHDRTIIPMTFLIGTSDFDRRDTKDFIVSAYDSIAYIGFRNDSNKIFKMFDLKSNKICCNYSTSDTALSNQLLNRLKIRNKNLRLY